MKSKYLTQDQRTESFQEIATQLQNQPITLDQANKVLSIIDKGLIDGMGDPVPGKMCVEAAVCYALNLPHSDHPVCVDLDIAYLKITLNDLNWSSKAARAKGMRDLAIAQLGTNKVGFNYDKFAKYLAFDGLKYLGILACEKVVYHAGKDEKELISTFTNFSKLFTNSKTPIALVNVLRKINVLIDAGSNILIDVNEDYEMAFKNLNEVYGDNDQIDTNGVMNALSYIVNPLKPSKYLDGVLTGFANIFIEALSAGNAEGYKLLKQLK